VLRLTLLAPEIVEAALAGTDPRTALPRWLQPFPVAWVDQRAVFSGSSIGDTLVARTVGGDEFLLE
jgi:hypothetical protein